MTTFTRKNAWNNNGTFSNSDLLWYAKGIQVMQSRKLNDPTSWWFFAAIHGEYVLPGSLNGRFPDWADIPGVPSVPTTPLPNNNLVKDYWDQCQHAGWFFPPWHRGYLYAIENILREIIQSLGGPTDWALPYWNYFGPAGQYKIPPAFTQQKLPDGTSNPLFVTARYGPNGNGAIFVQIPPLSLSCQLKTVYTDQYGGGETGFDHFDSSTGALESNPHNEVHSQVGGNSNNSNYYGLMSDPGLAAIDPIFYLHHCNIDRLWASWNANGNSNPTDSNWLNGPTAMGDRKFNMPNSNGTEWQFTPKMVNSINQLKYDYDDLSSVVTHPLLSRISKQLRNFEILENKDKSVNSMDNSSVQELVGANNGVITLTDSGARTLVKLDSIGWKTVTRSLKIASAKDLPDEVYLQFEGVKGNSDANRYSVSVNQNYVGHISLFGLRTASRENNKHGGGGLTIKLDITQFVDQLHLTDETGISSLDVLIQPSGPTLIGGECSIARVSIYRKGKA